MYNYIYIYEMPLQTTGVISITNIKYEYNQVDDISMSDLYGISSGIPTSGAIKFSNFYGKSSGEKVFNAPPGAQANGYFGGEADEICALSVNRTGSTFIVGEPGRNVGALTAVGRVYRYSNYGNTNVYIECPSQTANARFGQSLWMSRGVGKLAVGAPGLNRVYFFDNLNGVFTLTNSLTGTNSFGSLVAGQKDQNDFVVIGGVNSTSVTIAKMDANVVATAQQTVTNANLLSTDGFGSSGAIISDDGLHLAIGAPNRSTNIGSVYYFNRTTNTGTFVQQQRIDGNGTGNSLSSGYFGRNIVFNADVSRMLVSSMSASNRGAVSFFTRSGNTWTFVQVFQAPSPANNAYFGASLNYIYTSATIPKAVVIIGENGRNTNTGQAYKYVFNDGLWAYDSTITLNAPVAGGRFSYNMAVGLWGTSWVANAPLVNSNAGQVYTNTIKSYSVITQGLALWYDVSNASSVLNDLGTITVMDLSGNDRLATLQGGATVSSGRIILNGASQYVSTTYLPNLDNNRLYTFELWFWDNAPGGFTDNTALISNYGPTGPTPNVALHITSAGAPTITEKNSVNTTVSYMHTSSVCDGTWKHIAMVGNATQTSLYINGVAVGSINRPGGVITSSMAIVIGGNHLGRYQTCRIGPVRIYIDKALTYNEIESNYNAERYLTHLST